MPGLRPGAAASDGVPVTPLVISWVEEPGIAEAARFLASVIALDPAYISHGEIQCGLSPDGRRWADDLGAMIEADLAGRGPDRRVAAARDEGGAIRAAAVLLTVATPRLHYAVIEDLAVDPDCRSSGVGARLVVFLERELAAQGIAWSFLESGRGNQGAHRFFERLGYEPVSTTFAKRL